MRLSAITFFGLSLYCALGLAAQTSSIFSNAEIRIDFAGPFSIRIEPGATVYRDLLPRPLQTVDFCRWQPQDPDVQQVNRPETGYLCEMHILHVQSVAEIMAAVRKSSEKPRADRGTSRNLTYSEFHGLRVIQWRFQAGKSRLDHFLVLGKAYNYLFVSSPYGSNGLIEEILMRTQIR
ncbi:MAG: hypothetical protein J0L53_11375 [Spirochaetes bacterium]|nr:hypothetical protein [Spirochaetota bacterium]MBX3720420.1 hypothetical protein [Turneriella sp.]